MRRLLLVGVVALGSPVATAQQLTASEIVASIGAVWALRTADRDHFTWQLFPGGPAIPALEPCTDGAGRRTS